MQKDPGSLSGSYVALYNLGSEQAVDKFVQELVDELIENGDIVKIVETA